MDEFVAFSEAEKRLWEKNIVKYRDILNISAESWSSFVVAHYFTDIADGAALVIAYKTQADKALFYALNSVLNQHLGQASTQIRFAIENLNIAIAGIYDYDALEDIYEKHGVKSRAEPLNEDVKRAAYKIIEQKHPEQSEKIKKLKMEILNLYGSHQSIALLGTNFEMDRSMSRFKLSLFDKNRPEMFVGLIGIVGSIVHIHNPMFVDAVKVDSRYLQINKSALEAIEQQRLLMEDTRLDIENILSRLISPKR